MYPEYLNYPERYAYMLSFMHHDKMLFVDEYFNGKVDPNGVLGEIDAGKLKTSIMWVAQIG